MKILIIRNFPSYMAIKNNTYNIQEVGLAKALVRKGHTCDIIFWTDKQDETCTIPVDNIGEVHVFYRHGKTILKNTIFIGCDELFSQYDILQPCEYNQIQAWLLAKNQPEKTVIYHGPYYSAFNKRYNLMCKIFDTFFLRQYIHHGTKFMAKSELAKKFLSSKGIKPENIATVGVGIDAAMLSDGRADCDESLYEAMKSNSDYLKLLYIGRFEERRNIPFIIDVFTRVLKNNEDARLYMIGTGEKEYMDRCFAYMEQNGVRDKIIWQEKMEQKYLSNVYQLADFFLLPTEYEIFGMVLLEAMYYGAVVLTTRNGGSSTLIKNGKNGFILESKSAQKWAECIIKLQENCDARKKICENAAKTIGNGYTWDALANKFIKQYADKVSM